VREIVFIATPQTAQAWTNMPAATTELFGSTRARVKVPLTGDTQFRLEANQSAAGAAGARLRMQYSTDQVTWNDLESVTTTGELPVSAAALNVGAFAPIVAAAKADVFLRVVGFGGDGVADPAWRVLLLEVQ
jgi:hypothetical protein